MGGHTMSKWGYSFVWTFSSWNVMAFSPTVLGYLVKKGLQKGRSRAPQDPPWLCPCIVLKSTRHKVLLIDLIPEKEYEHLLKKITPMRILMLSEYKGEFQHVSSQNVIDISSSNLPPRKIWDYSIHSYSRIMPIEGNRIQFYCSFCYCSSGLISKDFFIVLIIILEFNYGGITGQKVEIMKLDPVWNVWCQIRCIYSTMS